MKKDIVAGLIFAAFTLVLAVAAKVANARGYIDHDTLMRVVAVNGLVVIYFGNQLPKSMVPYAWAQRARRFSGWSLVLSGLVYIGLWLFAPIPVAIVFGTGAVFAGVILGVVNSVWLASRARTHA